MTLIGLFDPFDDILGREYATVEEFVEEWARGRERARGNTYVYAFRDAGGSVFYIGKGTGDRAHDTAKHHHGRLGYYVAKMLDGPYTVDILKRDLTNDDAELLEALLIQKFGRQLVNWAGQWSQGDLDAEPPPPALPTYADTRAAGQALRARAKVAATQSLEDAVALCREALAHISDWERLNAAAETNDLERRATTEVGARVDLHMARHASAPRPPVPANDLLSDLTIYLCRLGRAEEARREVEDFTARYPHGSFREYEEFDRRTGQRMRIPVAKREQATLARVEAALKREA